MNLRYTYWLFGVVVVVVIVFALVLTFGPRPEGDFLLADLRGKTKEQDLDKLRKEIDKVEIERLRPKDAPIVFERSGSGWRMTLPFPARVDSATIDHVIGALLEAGVDRQAALPPRAQMGLDDPSAAITLSRGGKPYRLLLG